MLNHIISFSVRNKMVIGLFTVALLIWGVFELSKLPVDAVPDITDNQVQVITASPSLGATDIERLITFPIEQSCSNVPGLKQIRSFSRFGLSLVTIVFSDQTDIYWARQQISERLQLVSRDLPHDIGTPELAPITTGLGEIYQYVIRPQKGYEQQYDAMQLRTLQDWVVRRQLLGTPGVAEVSSFGGKLKQYEIAVNPSLLKANNITISDIYAALEKNNQNTGGAYIDKGPTVLYIRSEGLISGLEDVGRIVVRTLSSGLPVQIRDIAEVRMGSAIRYGAMTYNDQGEVAGAVVMMLKGENSSVVVKRVKEKIARIQKDLPEGVVIEPFLDRTKMVNSAIETVARNLAEGALIVVFVLVFFLGNLRAGLIVSSVIPLSMLFAIILMNQFGVSGNLMSLGAIDFGLIVDGSVIIVEAILHRFAHSQRFKNVKMISQTEMDEEVSGSTGGSINSAVFSQIIILIVYLPILSLEGIEGKMFKPMALTIAFAIFGAFVLSITYVPMMNALLLHKKLRHQKTLSDKMTIWLERTYQPALRRMLAFPKSVIGITLVLFAVSVVLTGALGGEFIPQLEEGDFAVETRLLTGSNLDNTIASTQKASGVLLGKFPEVQKVVTKIGSAEIPTDPMPLEAGDMIVVLKNKKEWTSARSFPELAERMTEALKVVPGITVGFQFPVQMRFNELMTGARQDVVCKIFGENLDSLVAYAHRLSAIINSVPGAINIYEERVTGMPQITIRFNRDAIARYGLNIQDVNNTINTAFAGKSAGQVYEGERRFDLVVRLHEHAKQNINDIRNLMIATPSGLQIPVSQIAEVSETEGVNQIQRENTMRRIVVGFNVSGHDVQSIVSELQHKVDNQLKLPAGYHIVYGGSFENMNTAKERLSVVVPVALLLIFLLLYFAFGSVKQGLLVYTAIPLSAMGGIYALWIRDMPFSISAGVGFIALFGVAVLNGILLVTEFNRLKKQGWKDMDRIVIHGTKSKLRAVLMTALVPSLGFIPMAVSTGAGGAVQKPLATVVIGGLIISTLLTLFVLPILYIVFEKSAGYRNAKKVFTLALLFGLPSFTATAQKAITLEDVLRAASVHYPALAASTLNERYHESMVGAAFDIPHVEVTYEYGNTNSFLKDNRYSVTQSIQFPTVYAAQRRINRTAVAASRSQTRIKLAEMQAEVKELFYSLLVLEQRKRLLQFADSIYEHFRQKAERRYRLGDTDILELSTAENQRLQISTQLKLLLADETNQKHRLQTLTGMELTGLLSDSIVYSIDPSLLNGYDVSASPTLQLQEQQLRQSRQNYQLEKQKLLPNLSIGYYNASFAGWQEDAARNALFYTMSDRFQSISAGITIPLFPGSQLARIKALQYLSLQAARETEAVRMDMETNLRNASVSYYTNMETLQDYVGTALPNAEKIIATATARLHSGDISYLNWVILINQAIEVKMQYYQMVERLNANTIEIEKLNGTIK